MEHQDEVRVAWGTGIAGYVAESGDMVNIPDAYKDERFNNEIDLLTGYRTKALLCMPIKDGSGDVVGVAQVINKLNGEQFTQNDEKVRFVAHPRPTLICFHVILMFHVKHEINFPFADIWIVSAVLRNWTTQRSTVREVTVGGETEPGVVGSGSNDFRGAEYDRAHGLPHPDAHAEPDPVPASANPIGARGEPRQLLACVRLRSERSQGRQRG